ncbi:MAG: hypothetical protein FJZ64_04410 [Chlamydiae bacterium]|nr:hypothetical protein [Chlamydiota bacterium]
MEKQIAKDFGFTKILPISGQTYPRKIDLFLLNALGSFAASAHKMATDIRLLAHDGELLESFEPTQVGSSAMPYKRNPIYSERICGLARFVMSLTQNPAYTTATQWLERSLDDSSNRRLSIPEAFLGVDAIINLLAHLIRNLRPMKNIAMQRLKKEMPSLVMENILMQSVQKGGDRQELHEKLRRLSQKPIDILIKEVSKDPEFRLTQKEIESLLKVPSLIGLAPEQTLLFLKERVQPFLNKWEKSAVTLPLIEL